MFDTKWQRKEMPLSGLISLGGGAGGLGVISGSGVIQQLRVLHANGTEEDIGEKSSYDFQDGDIIEPILADYTVIVKCAGQRGHGGASSSGADKGGLGAWVKGTIEMKYGAKYYVRVSGGIGAIYWGDSGEIPADNVRCMMLGAEGGGAGYWAGFFDTRFSWADEQNMGLGGDAGTPTPGSSGTEASGDTTRYGSAATCGPGTGASTNGYMSGSGGSGGTVTGAGGNGAAGGLFSAGLAARPPIAFEYGGHGGMGYYGGGGGAGTALTGGRSGGGGGGGSSYHGGIPNTGIGTTSLTNPNNDHASSSVSNTSSGLNNDPATVTTAFVKMESTPTVTPQKESYWEGYEYGAGIWHIGPSGEVNDSPFDQISSNGVLYGWYTRTGAPSVNSGGVASREREIIWDGQLVESSGSGSENSATPPNANGWIIKDGYAYTWADIVTIGYFNGGTTQIASPPGTTSGNGNQTPQVGSYYPWQGDQCNCWNIIRVDARIAETTTADQIRISALAARAAQTSPGVHFSSKDLI
tara:strand:+ start:1627 stop:3198 length:1572 start_codon:yes stop_codon:yes gene_type:complete